MKRKLTLTVVCVMFVTGLYAQSTTLTLPTSDNTSNFNVANTSATIMNLNGDAGFYLGGTVGTGTIPIEGEGARLMWYPKKSAFRVGYDLNDNWNDTEIGDYSVAMGYDTKAGGLASTSLGLASKADGNYSCAIGYNANATGDYSFSVGISLTASGSVATAFGGMNTASGNGSSVFGGFNTASGDYSFAFGNANTASGNYSTVTGYTCTAQAYASLVLGRYNIVEGTTDSWVDTEPVLVVGNGTSTSSRSNAFTLLKNGSLTIAGSLSQNSDRRLKTDIVPLFDALSSIEQITPVYYKFKDTKNHPANRQIGFIAQEIEPFYPELISRDANGTLSVDYGKMSAVLLQAIKEQQVLIAEKNSELESAKARITELEKTRIEQNNLASAQQNSISVLTEKLAAIETKINEIENYYSQMSYADISSKDGADK